MTPGKQVCLATATTERFVPGTLVLIDSFLRRHPGFDGEVVVIHDGLPGEARAVLAAASDAVRFAPVPPALRERVYADLLAAMSPAHWRDLEMPLGEQPLLNRYFAGRQTLVSSTYNFLIYGAAAIRAREGVDLRRAKVVHFNTVAKPWRPDAMLRWTWDRWNPPAVAAFKLWHDAYVEALVNARVRTAVRGWAGWTVA